MRAVRHKTIKGGFRIIFWFIVVVQLAACCVAAYGVFALHQPRLQVDGRSPLPCADRE
jgi:hypothetical protein